jgi:hypothetical protein
VAEIALAHGSGRHLTPARAQAELHKTVGRYRLDEALKSLRGISVSFSNPDACRGLPRRVRALWPATINAHQIAYIAKLLIQKSDDSRLYVLSFPEYEACARLYNDAQNVGLSEEDELSKLHLTLLQMAFLQYRHQLPVSHQLFQVPRTLLLFGDIPRRLAASGYSIPDSFTQLTGLTVEDFVAVGLWIFMRTWAMGMESFEKSDVVQPDVPSLAADKIDRFLSATAADYSAFRTLCDQFECSDPVLAHYAFNPLEMRPIIRTSGSGYLVPVPQLLLDRITLGIYHDLLTADNQVFTQAFGPPFETYVGDLLKSFLEPSDVFGERLYGPKKARRLSTDWIVVEGNAATQLECKVSRVRLETRVTADRELLRADLAKAIAVGVHELARVIQDIQSGFPDLEPFRQIATFQSAIVVFDPFHLGNSPVVRELVNEELQHRGTAPIAFQILGVDEIERAWRSIRKRGLTALLAAKVSASDQADPNRKYSSIAEYLSSFSSLSDFLSTVAGPEEQPTMPPLLEARWKALMTSLRAQFSAAG